VNVQVDPGAPPHSEAAPLGRAAFRFAILILLLVGTFVLVKWTPVGGYLRLERLQGVLAQMRGAWWAPVAFLVLFAGAGAVGVPATPFILLGAAIFGFSWGVVWNWSGIVLGSVVGYGLARLLGREFIERIGGSKVRRAEKQFQRRGFLPLVAARFVPIPFAIVNAAAAVVGVRFGRFLLSTAIGMLPPITIFTYFSTALLEAATGERAVIARHLVYASVSAAFVVFVPLEVRRRLRKRRLARLRFHRAGRPSRS